MSAYAKLPSSDGARDDESRSTSRDDAVRQVREQAERLAGSIGRGVRRAASELEGPSEGLSALVEGADLPEVGSDDALSALARRLDREADLWRGLAVRELAHVAWANRLAHLASALTLIGVLGLSTLAAVQSVFGAGPGRALLVATGAAVLCAGAVVASVVSGAVRKSQREVVREALVRADVAELRLHRVAVTLAATKLDPTHARDALVRLERDVVG